MLVCRTTASAAVRRIAVTKKYVGSFEVDVDDTSCDGRKSNTTSAIDDAVAPNPGRHKRNNM
jgi:hypothetical protein